VPASVILDRLAARSESSLGVLFESSKVRFFQVGWRVMHLIDVFFLHAIDDKSRAPHEKFQGVVLRDV